MKVTMTHTVNPLFTFYRGSTYTLIKEREDLALLEDERGSRMWLHRSYFTKKEETA
ncbi:hypothetical protein NKI13_18580 [Mesorhizobium australicum]|uniref:hypothetical protein n=1 Tax=Mesorhizobium australicum TaxID=536018 RepID=UPI00333B1173